MISYFKRFSLSLKFTIVSIFSLIILFTLGAIFTSRAVREEVDESLLKLVQVNFRACELELVNFLSNSESIGSSVANAGELYFDQSKSNAKLAKQNTDYYLNRRLEHEKQIQSLFIQYEPNSIQKGFLEVRTSWENNQVTTNWKNSEYQNNYLDLPWYKIAIPEGWDRSEKRNKNFQWTKPSRNSSESGRENFSISLVTFLHDSNQKIIGIAGLNLSLEKLFSSIYQFRITENSELAIIDLEQNTILYHINKELILKEPSVLEEYKLFHNEHFVPGEIRGTEDSDSKIYYTQIAKRYLLFSSIPKSDANQFKNQYLTSRLTVFLLILIIYSAIIYFSSKRILKPLNTIVHKLGTTAKNKKLEITDYELSTRDETKDLSSNLQKIFQNFQTEQNKAEKKIKSLEDKLLSSAQNLEIFQKDLIDIHSQNSADLFFVSKIQNTFHKTEIQKAPIKTEFLIKQKKTFDYKSQKIEMGGDLCMSLRIEIHAHSYTLFANADGMGTSLQGAISATIFGSILWSIVERTKLSPYTWSKSTEKWLQDCYREVDFAIKNFNKLVEISTIIGLIDHQDETLSYINAGNPKLITYRNQKATYTETEKKSDRIGSPGLEKNIFINTIQIKPGDVYFCGSDGKDNLNIYSESKDSIGSIPDLTKYWIESSQGNLAILKQKILESGLPGKDISFIKISYEKRSETESGIEALG